jgi:two-component system sensor histidine kinase DegS
MLNYGLKPAIEELSDGLLDRHESLNILTTIVSNENRYDPQVEQHIFRIAQEACENAIRHGHAANINISGYLHPTEIFLKIEDDGSGFDGNHGNEFAHLLADKHFGLAGMMERARLINGEVKIHSTPAAGTSIEVAWKVSGAV